MRQVNYSAFKWSGGLHRELWLLHCNFWIEWNDSWGPLTKSKQTKKKILSLFSVETCYGYLFIGVTLLSTWNIGFHRERWKKNISLKIYFNSTWYGIQGHNCHRFLYLMLNLSRMDSLGTVSAILWRETTYDLYSPWPRYYFRKGFCSKTKEFAHKGVNALFKGRLLLCHSCYLCKWIHSLSCTIHSMFKIEEK